MTLLDCLSANDGMFTTEDLDSRRQRLRQLQELVFEFNIDYQLGEDIEFLRKKYIEELGYDSRTNLPSLDDFLVTYYFNFTSKLISSLKNKSSGLVKKNKNLNWIYTIDNVLEDIQTRRSILLTRLLFLSYKKDEVQDEMRKYHYVSAFSHSFRSGPSAHGRGLRP